MGDVHTNSKTATKGRAILVMCAGVLSLVINDAIAKGLVARFDPFQILLARSLIALPIVAGLALWTGGAKALRSGGVRVHILRAVLAVAATYLFIRSLADLPLAEATSIIFAAPIFVAALSMPLLKQRVGLQRGLAVVAGFTGVLIVLQPGADTLKTAALLALAAAAVNALVMMSARWIDQRDGFWTMTLYMTLFSGVACAFTLAGDWPTVARSDVGLFLGMAVAGTLGIALISHAFRISEAAVVAPFDYTALIWATALGWALWGAVPGPSVYMGALVIVASGIYLIFLEDRQGA
ncbi:MAG: DMT family transporter [Inquilinaceae bacterium]